MALFGLIKTKREDEVEQEILPEVTSYVVEYFVDYLLTDIMDILISTVELECQTAFRKSVEVTKAISIFNARVKIYHMKKQRIYIYDDKYKDSIAKRLEVEAFLGMSENVYSMLETTDLNYKYSLKKGDDYLTHVVHNYLTNKDKKRIDYMLMVNETLSNQKGLTKEDKRNLKNLEDFLKDI